MKIHLCSAYREHNALERFKHFATIDQHKKNQLCDRPEDADIILFVEDAQFDDYLYSQLLTHPFVQQWRDKCFMYNEVDRPWVSLPGLYCSMPQASFEENRQRAFPYAATPNQRIQDIFAEGESTERPILFSFVGTGCNSLRKRMITVGQQQGGTIIDTSGFNVWDCSEEEKRAQGDTFASTLSQSKFALCPRGLGTSSFRLFETMQAGRAPVIIADDWVAPSEIDWSFAVRIKEADIDALAERLSAISDEAFERGRAARAVWEQHYAPEQMFNSACNNLREIQHSATTKLSPLNTLLRREQVRVQTAAIQAAEYLRVYKRRLSST